MTQVPVLFDNDNLFLIQNDDGKATKAIMTDGQSNLVGQPKFAKEIAVECFTFCTVATPSTLRSLGKNMKRRETSQMRDSSLQDGEACNTEPDVSATA